MTATLRFVLVSATLIFGFAFNGFSQNLAEEKRAYANEVYKLARQRNDTTLLAEAYYLFGKLAIHEDNTKAAAWFHKALKLLENKPPSFEKGRLFNQLRNISGGNGLKEEESYYKAKARETIIQANSERGFRQFKDLFVGLETYVESDTVRKSFTRKDIDVLQRVAFNQCKQGKYAKARRNLNKILDLTDVRKKDELFIKINSLLTLSVIDSKENKVDDAKSKISQAEKLSNPEFAQHQTVKNSFDWARQEYAIATQDWKAAYEQLEKINNWKLNKAEADRNAAISQLRIEYEVERKEELLAEQGEEISLKEQNLRLQRWTLLGLGALLFALLAVLYYVMRLYKVNERISKRNALLLVEQNHRVKNNLQFISSMLSVQKETLKGKGEENEIEGIQLRIESMAILQRTLYADNKVSETNIEEFVEEVLNSVLTSCDGEHIETQIDIPELFLSADKSLPIGLIITELCINSCKHAFEGVDFPLISVNILRNKKKLVLHYADNGVGIDPGLITKGRSGGFGFELIRLQVEQLNGSVNLVNNNTLRIEFPA